MPPIAANTGRSVDLIVGNASLAKGVGHAETYRAGADNKKTRLPHPRLQKRRIGVCGCHRASVG
jgi:hypothetical protein